MAARNPKLKKRATSLREQGYSYNEICQQLNIAKSTCSIWLRNIRLNDEAIQRLVEKQDQGRRIAALTLRQYRKERNDYIRVKAQKSVEAVTITTEIGKVLCAALYWGEGEKKNQTVAFSNSDPVLIKVFLNLFRKYFSIDEQKLRALLHLHSYHDVVKQKRYWSKVTGIPISRISIYLKANSGKNIRPGYPGCISIRYYDVRLAREIEFLYNALVDKVGGVG